MFFTEEKISKRVNELEQYRYINRTNITGWINQEDTTKECRTVPEDNEGWEKIEVGHIWKGINKFFWLKTTLDVPVSENAQVMLFDLGLIGNLKHTGIEALLYINEKPYQGVDCNHKEVFLDKKYQGTTIRLALRIWTGRPGRKGDSSDPMMHMFKMADLAEIENQVDNLYYLSKNAIETVGLLDNNDPRRVELVNELDATFNKIDWSLPGSKTFYESCHAANVFLTDSLQSHKDKKPEVTINGIGHTHIDLAWLWRVKNTKEKAARSFSTVLRLMDKYPEYTFLHSTPQLYEYVKENYPDIFEQIKKRVAEGRWETDGAMWVEADCNIPSGESIVRQILYGTRFFEKEFGQKTHTLWLPDVFGYSWALPQILKKSGITTFMTTKLSWNEFNRMPHDTFYWKGMDGSKILTHFITTPDPNDSKGPFYYTYNGVITPETVTGIYKSYQDKNINSDLLLAYGYGDGGGGANRDMLENIRAINQISALPKITTTKTAKYFEKLHKNIDEAQATGKYVHTWDGELYFEYHRATYTGHAANKRNNRKIEILLRKVEFLEVQAMLQDANWKYPTNIIEKSWKLLLKNQFHDILPGSAIHQVYEDSQTDFNQIYKNLNQCLQEINNKFAKNEKEYTITNDLSWKRNDVIKLDQTDNGQYYDEFGNKLDSQVVKDGTLVYVDNVPSFGTLGIKFDDTKQGPKANNAELKNSIQNDFYRITWNNKGQLTEIFDIQNQRNVLGENSFGNVLEIFEDKPREYDAWNLDISYKQKKKELSANKIEIVASGKICTIVRFTYEFNQSKLVQDMILYNKKRRIDFKTKVDWHERQQILKASFYTNIRSTQATYQIQYGNVKRPTNWNNSWNMAKFETVGHQWADLSEHNYGVALLNDSKYGYDIFDNKLSLSLLTGSISPDKTADIGHHEFTYSLLPHQGDFVSGHVEQAAWELNSPLSINTGKLAINNSLLEVSKPDKIFVDTVKKAEDSNAVIVRLHDYSGETNRVSLKLNFKFKEIKEVDLRERECDSNNINLDGETIKLDFSPYEIKTVKIKL
ncbi:alpha-mannosidase [Lactobacillus sp. ESL0731]|uniref:alpha-mannosidase n=1 Tax=unclassified Lactobacillus TaxID=2620435 RepID=UPI0023F9FCB1|nr:MULTISPECIES: alpha-mannosidase [unclassified Lactobacillus]WEV51082.1 alpha-mannosidase [Lactobacillus sp. ESL0700]WEV62211.1 alpha-mannosidase [Lactobacillus sp. ESL0731]